MRRKEKGMTVLEVIIAITILLIGTSFVVQSNSLSYNYLKKQEIHQQMVFFAAGRMEAALEGKTSFDSTIMAYPFNTFTTTFVDHTIAPDDRNLDIPVLDGKTMALIPFKVIISAPGQADVEMYNYQVNLHDD
ncbi:prepilin-type N-terminal cleavage/methylation domain-containing protein [Desulfosporosinus orientis DSM 765]|uniref:Prepilin-type N-terminal cleavage/methylation domain-containing protein n=1 Tax=Desulfosporosinus orientis (strain ATCC 19365 / DSM 765 / NCIMB 8382 / VKM B-1628 / Singapore I) TaxID=768706 RepID=G7W5M0_DESOD|nr:type II secretion system protein [Desulfosporosinus orientis]AET66667.1 prepilin-type N-terminal cleavage/methylation domain-containing protein [Desulfosporosinus orientis DSM 765]